MKYTEWKSEVGHSEIQDQENTGLQKSFLNCNLQEYKLRDQFSRNAFVALYCHIAVKYLYNKYKLIFVIVLNLLRRCTHLKTFEYIKTFVSVVRYFHEIILV